MLNALRTSKIGLWVMTLVMRLSTIHWTQKHPIKPADKTRIAALLKSDYYVVLTRRSNWLATYLISIANLVMTGRTSLWSHVLLNLEDEVSSTKDFRLVEAISTGTTFSTFEHVFNEDVDAVCLLKPVSMTIEEWTKVLDAAKAELGKPYDTLFDIANNQAISCVELVRLALQRGVPDYATRFAAFEALIEKRSNLTPQMFFDCDDFEVAYMIKR